MGTAVSELLQVLAVVVVAYMGLTALALFLKAESVTWEQEKSEELEP